MDKTEQNNNGVQRGGGALYRKVHADLRRRVLGGEFLADGRLPTEPELAASYGVSIITIRQAQQLLVEEDLLCKQQGRRTFVSPAARGRMKILWVCAVTQEAESIHPFFANVLSFSAAECAALGYRMEHAWIRNFTEKLPPPYDTEDYLKEFLGVVFVNCNNCHLLLTAVRRLGLRHVLIGGIFAGPGRASIDLRGAIRMGLAANGRTSNLPIVVGLDSHQSFVYEVAAALGIAVRWIAIPYVKMYAQYEAMAYEYLRDDLLKDGTRNSFLFMDDFFARGGTRALLELGYGQRDDLRVSVICGRQEMIPLGLPVRWIVHDTRMLVSEGFRLLNDKITGTGNANAGYMNKYEVLDSVLSQADIQADIT